MSKLKLWNSSTEAVLCITFLLIILGTLNVFSASFVEAGQKLDDGYYFLKRHMVSLMLGFACMVMAIKINYFKWKKIMLIGGVAAALCLIAVHFVGVEVNGSRRWLNLGITFQPSELAKLTIVFISATYLGPIVDRHKQAHLSSMPVFLALFMGFFIYKQPDLGTAAIVVGLAVILYIVAGLSKSDFFILGTLSLIGIFYLTTAASYRAERIAAWFDPWMFKETTGYQTVQSLMAIGSGGFFGNGLGMGLSKFYYLPEAHTDFAFAVLCQEMGFIGAFAVLILLSGLAFYGGKIARETNDGYGKILVMGIICLIVGQGIANIAMVSGMLPVIGVPLPFISYGGTSLIINMFSIGVLINIGRYNAGLRKENEKNMEPEVVKRKLRLARN